MLQRPSATTSTFRRLIAAMASVAVAAGMIIAAPTVASADETRTIAGTFTVPAVGPAPWWAGSELGGTLYTGDGEWVERFELDTTAQTFSITGLAPGTYRLQFDNGTYCGYSGCVSSNLLGGYYGGGEGALIDVTLESQLGLVYAYETGRTITGTISLPVDAPASWKQALYATVSIPGPEGCQCGDSLPFQADPVTGAFTIAGLLPGSYQVQFSGQPSPEVSPRVNLIPEYYNDSLSWAGATRVDVTSDNATGIDATLAMGRTISGTVSLPGGISSTEFEYINVEASGADDTYAYSELDPATGDYTLYGLSSTSYKVKFTTGSRYNPYPTLEFPVLTNIYYGGSYTEAAATPIDTTGGDVTGADVTMVIGRTISGTVTLDPNADDIWRHLLTAYAESDGNFRGGTVNPTTGAYTITGLAPGSHLVNFQASGYSDGPTWVQSPFAYEYYNNKRNPYTANLIDVSGGNVTGINAQMDLQVGPREFWVTPTPTITGTAVAGSTLTAVTGEWEPYASTIQYQWKRNGVDISGATEETYTLTQADALANITVAVTGSSTNFTPVTVTSAATAVAATQFTAAPTPTISGTPTVGQTLTANPGAWSPMPTLTFQWTRNGADIPAATTPTYTLVGADSGATIAVKVTGTLTGYATTMKPSAAVTVDAAAFAAAPTPTISGTTTVGQTLTAVTGTWSPVPAFGYQWTRNGTDIASATAATYALVPADAGATIAVKVTGTLAGYTTTTRTSTGATIATAPFTTAPTPTVSGTPAVGETLTASAGSWTPTPSLAYQWTRNGVDIASATSTTYTLVSADAGATIAVKVTGTLAGYTTTTKTSTGVAVPAVFSSAPTPTILGNPAVGLQLFANTGTWTPTPTLTYQWTRNGADIPSATAALYSIVPADEGATLAVKVTGTLAGYATTTRTSATVTVVEGQFVAAPTPTITGTPVVGEALTAQSDAWSPSATLTYQWLRDGNPIAGATQQSYTLVADDGGADITVAVTGSADGYATQTKTSDAVTPSGAAFTSTTVAVIAGTAKVGEVLTASVADWSPVATFTYQWQRNGAAIDGATESTYTVVAADAGARISVAVTGSSLGYEKTTTVSAETGTVAKATFTTAPTPTISGSGYLGATLTAKPGTWVPAASGYTYQWYRSGAAISGATKSTYKLTSSDSGKKITVKVTASRSGYTSVAKTSAAVTLSKFFTKVGAVAISGTVKVGYTVTASRGTWSPTPSSYSYQWYRSGVAISGATKSTYKLTASDASKQLTVKVTAKRSGYASQPKTSAAKTVALGSFSTAPTPKITGTVKVGYTVTASRGTWSPTPSTYSYQWYRNGVAISGATKSTYKLSAQDAATKLTVKVTAKKTGYSSKAKLSAATTVARGTFSTAPTPKITGTAKVGSTLTASTGTWSPTPTSFSYQWYRNGAAISGATASTRVLVSADKGKTITVKVTAKRSGYTSTAKTSAKTATVK